MHFPKLIPLLAIAALATGCATTGGVKQWGAVEAVSTEKALAFPPPGGPAIVSVVERTHGDDVEQQISLYTSSSVTGQNFLKVQFYGVEGPNPGIGSTPYQGISQWAISREMVSAIPGVRMTRSDTFLQNTYGPFAYASGRTASGNTCLYAWQQIHAGGVPPAGQPRNFNMVQVRIRLCDARATERQLLTFVYGYTISGGFVAAPLTPLGAPQGADTVLGPTNAPIYPDVGPYRNNPMASGYEPRAAAPVTV
ncbi:MAG: cellulose biosynthesis protein BcsN, partial [Rhizobiaceae bacterium]|nr:cellulose biosynthesis protein BcsN [Rhizobiaceae bacterium]